MTISISREDFHRAWCGCFQWPGREPFTFGTVLASTDARTQEIEAEVTALLAKKLVAILPINSSLPKLIGVIPGALFLQSRDDAD